MIVKLKFYQWAVGACDTCTGLLLVAAPAFTFKLMGMGDLSGEVSVYSFVGIFVMAVGLSYFLTKTCDLQGWKMQWKVTALVRCAVALFLTYKIATGWDWRWVSVVLTDAVFGVTQLIGLKKGWLDK